MASIMDVANTLTNLYYRWHNESDYKDFDDHARELKSVVDQTTMKFKEMTAVPFGFKWEGKRGVIYHSYIESIIHDSVEIKTVRIG